MTSGCLKRTINSPLPAKSRAKTVAGSSTAGWTITCQSTKSETENYSSTDDLQWS